MNADNSEKQTGLTGFTGLESEAATADEQRMEPQINTDEHPITNLGSIEPAMDAGKNDKMERINTITRIGATL